MYIQSYEETILCEFNALAVVGTGHDKRVLFRLCATSKVEVNRAESNTKENLMAPIFC